MNMNMTLYRHYAITREEYIYTGFLQRKLITCNSKAPTRLTAQKECLPFMRGRVLQMTMVKAGLQITQETNAYLQVLPTYV
jgi:hypothetical protein